ncbi:MAG: hypothetical protein ACLPX5_01905 [Dissulfurispiraceae bacterium]
MNKISTLNFEGQKTVGFRKQKSDSHIGLGRSASTCVETIVRRVVVSTRTTQGSMIRETATSTAVGS